LRFCAPFGTILLSDFRVNPVGQTGRSLLKQSLRKLGLAYKATTAAAVLTLSVVLLAPPPATARPVSADAVTVALDALPQEARSMQRSILVGGPFPHAKDGVVFGNRERLLPVRPRGFYREYTVPTPGARTRGARRIVCGGQPATAPEACYYSDDHYASFRRIVQ
jgi:ribonuclease T1